MFSYAFFFFLNDTAPPEIYTLSLHDALPISPRRRSRTAGHRRDSPAAAGGSEARRCAMAGGPRETGQSATEKWEVPEAWIYTRHTDAQTHRGEQQEGARKCLPDPRILFSPGASVRLAFAGPQAARQKPLSALPSGDSRSFSNARSLICRILSRVTPISAPIFSSVMASLPSSRDRKSTRLNSSHSQISYAVFCLK